MDKYKKTLKENPLFKESSDKAEKLVNNFLLDIERLSLTTFNKINLLRNKGLLLDKDPNNAYSYSFYLLRIATDFHAFLEITMKSNAEMMKLQKTKGDEDRYYNSLVSRLGIKQKTFDAKDLPN
jgi:hypothetical protein